LAAAVAVAFSFVISSTFYYLIKNIKANFLPFCLVFVENLYEPHIYKLMYTKLLSKMKFIKKLNKNQNELFNTILN